MFDSLLGGKFSKKCKYCVKCINSRLELIRRKKHATVKILKKDVADLLANGHDSNAFGRIEALIVEINHTSCYDMIEQYCQCILNQLPCLQKQRECPEEAMEAVSTLIFAAARISDLPELFDLRRVFTERYGSHMESSVNAEFDEKMQKKSFSSDRKMQLMRDIAGEFSVKWDSKAFQQKISNPPAPPSDILKRSSNNNEQRSHAEMNTRNAANYQRNEAVFDAASEFNGGNRAAAANVRKEAAFNVDVTVDRKKEADINSGAAGNGGDRGVINGGSSFNGKKEVILNADTTVNGRKEAVMNSVFAVNRRNEAAVFSERGGQDVPSKERWEPPLRSSVQSQQVQPEPRDIHVIPIIGYAWSHDPGEKTRKVSAAAEETENVEPGYGNDEGRSYLKPKGSQNSIHKDDWFKPKVSQKGIHKDDRLNEGIACSRSPMAQEVPGLIGLEKQSVAQAISRDVKAVNMIPSYTNLKGVTNGSDAMDRAPIHNEQLPRGEKVLDPTVQGRWPTRPLNSKDARPIRMIPPPYTKPKFGNPSNPADDTKLTNEPVTSSKVADYEMTNGGERARSVSVRRWLPKPSLVTETENAVNDAKTMSQSPYVEENADRHHRKPAEEEMNGAVKHDQHVYSTSSSQRKHGSRRSNATYDGDYDEEEEVVDRLFLHLSKRGLSQESSKRRPRMRPPPAEVAADAGRAGKHRDDHLHHGNGRSHPSTTESVRHRPERVASFPPVPTSPVVEVSVSKGPALATSMNPDMLSSNGGRLHARLLPDYGDLAARFIALKNA